MAILTFVYVVATVVIVVFTKGSIDEMKKARIEDNRPYIFAYFAFVPREKALLPGAQELRSKRRQNYKSCNSTLR